MMPPCFWPRVIMACLICVGIWKVFEPKMILGKLGDFLNAWLPKWIVAPLFDCPPCMSSIWGTTIWFLTGGDFFWWPAFVFALCGLNTLVTIEILNRDGR